MTVDQYLSTILHPDCDFVDGRIEERNAGEKGHGKVQKMLLKIFERFESDGGIDTMVETRLQVTPSRFCVPDIMVVVGDDGNDRFVEATPLICIEVLSPQDTWKRLREKLTDYLEMGVPHIWAFDPETRIAHRFDAQGLHRVTEAELTVPGTEIRIDVAEAFSLVRNK
jgi:Uma2 family endonuclease